MPAKKQTPMTKPMTADQMRKQMDQMQQQNKQPASGGTKKKGGK